MCLPISFNTFKIKEENKITTKERGGGWRKETTLSIMMTEMPICRNVATMVLILDGNSEIGAHVRSNLCYLSCLKHLIRSRIDTNRIFSPIFFFTTSVRNLFWVTIWYKYHGLVSKDHQSAYHCRSSCLCSSFLITPLNSNYFIFDNPGVAFCMSEKSCPTKIYYINGWRLLGQTGDDWLN